eukprot:686064-Amphidinium_carterae.1
MGFTGIDGEGVSCRSQLDAIHDVTGQAISDLLSKMDLKNLTSVTHRFEVVSSFLVNTGKAHSSKDLDKDASQKTN